MLCASGVVGLALAAPPCGGYSLARLKPGGPSAIRTREHPDGLPALSASQLRELTVSRELHEFSRELLPVVAMRGGIILCENPVSSLTWKTRGAASWMRQFTPYLAQVAACQHGMNALKHWLFCSNRPVVLQLASACPHAKGTHPALSGKPSADGTFLTRLTALYPESLASAIASLFSPALTVRSQLIPFADWRRLLPARLPFSLPPRRIEDGCGTCSTANWCVRLRNMIPCWI